MLIDPDLGSRFSLRVESFSHADFSAELYLPLSSEELIDESDFEIDERLPYWAELWPSARALSRVILDMDEVPDDALELGCGVGLPSLALLHRGVDVLATDYYDDALNFARRNAELNELPPLRTAAVDWRDLPPALGRFSLAVGADLLYERRNVASLAAALQGVVEPGGSVILADPGRVYLDEFLQTMSAASWRVAALPQVLEAGPVEGRSISIRIFRIDRPRSAPR